MEVKRDILWRVYLSYLLVIVACIAIFGKAVYIQQVQGPKWRSMSDSLHQHIDSIEAERGTIYSEDGQMLSTSIPQFDLFIDFRVEYLHEKSGVHFRDNVDSLAFYLADLFKDQTQEGYKKYCNKLIVITRHILNSTKNYLPRIRAIAPISFVQRRSL